ncbi:hypothetical protein KC19_2G094000 [Ceratodon purpureus]|uniref:Uncharacterized protein n=1 Tax=Ceratodon purpureus TaxID=3225 RepID=A0A8T0IUU8_CERPU|nr:hypothetical protein KC19_2G094000 [Ceratodon purpureus]
MGTARRCIELWLAVLVFHALAVHAMAMAMAAPIPHQGQGGHVHAMTGHGSM